MSEIKKEHGIIVALDNPDIDKLYSIARQVNFAKGNFVLKIGRIPEMEHGISVISDIRDAVDIPIIYDGKIADIPHISAGIAERAYNAGADAVIVQGFVGLDVVEAVVDLEMGDVIVVMEMSHPGWFGHNHYPRNIVSPIDLANIGVDGVVLPATHPDLIRRMKSFLPPDIYIVSPGIGPQGGDIMAALDAGSDYPIVGRRISENPDPKFAAEFYYGWCVYWEQERQMCEGGVGCKLLKS